MSTHDPSWLSNRLGEGLPSACPRPASMFVSGLVDPLIYKSEQTAAAGTGIPIMKIKQ